MSPTFSIRIDQNNLDRIDRAAERYGETRSTYILSWVPEYEPDSRSHTSRDTPNSTNHDANERRV